MYFLDIGNTPNQCTKWKQDGFKCVDESMCQDNHFVTDTSRSVPDIRDDYDYDLDLSEV